MKKLILTILILCGAIFGQSRSVIFNTGSPDSLDYGYVIDSTHSAANRIYVANDYVLEAMVFYVTLESINGAINISFREDNNIHLEITLDCHKLVYNQQTQILIRT